MFPHLCGKEGIAFQGCLQELRLQRKTLQSSSRGEGTGGAGGVVVREHQAGRSWFKTG